MALTKTINVKVDTGDAEQELERLEGSFKEVDAAADKTNKSVDDVAGNGGAIAILDSLTGGLATRMRDAFEASKLFNISLKATRGALIATGIGAFVVILGTVVAFWDEIVEFITGANKKLQEQTDKTIRLQETTKLLVDLKTAEIDLAKKQGLATADLIKQKIVLVKLQQEQNTTEISLLEIQAARLKAAAFELTTREKIVRAAQNLLGAGVGDARILRNQLKDLEKFKDLQDSITQAKKEQIDLSSILFDLENPEKQKQERGDISPVSALKIEQDETFNLELENNIRLANLRRDRQITNRLIAEQETEEAKAELEKQLIFAQNVEIAKVDLANNTFGLISNIAKQGSSVAKGLAIANVVREQIGAVSGIISNTAIANAKAAAASPLTLGQPFVTLNTIAAGLGIAGSVAGAISAVKDITSEKKSPSGGSINIGGGAPQAPSFNLVAGSGTNQIAEGLASQQTPIKAFVVSSEQTTAASIDRNIVENASL